MTLVDSSAPTDRDEWLDTVYSDESLTTQCGQIPGTDLIWPTSSSTKPSLMARMLHLLDIQTGHRVLEIPMRSRLPSITTMPTNASRISTPPRLTTQTCGFSCNYATPPFKHPGAPTAPASSCCACTAKTVLGSRPRPPTERLAHRHPRRTTPTLESDRAHSRPVEAPWLPTR